MPARGTGMLGPAGNQASGTTGGSRLEASEHQTGFGKKKKSKETAAFHA